VSAAKNGFFSQATFGGAKLRNYRDGGEAILEAFRNLSVDYVISSPGSEWPSFWEAMARQKRDGVSGRSIWIAATKSSPSPWRPHTRR
jgi:hypothetical protein